MKKFPPYKVFAALCIITIFILVGISATHVNYYRHQGEESVSQILQNQETRLQRIAREIMILLMKSHSFDAQTVYVYDITNSEVIFEKNSDSQKNLASFAKIILARMLLEHTPVLDTARVCITEEALLSMNDQGFVAGDCYMVTDAIQAMLVSSSNDLATALALYAKDIPITLSEYIHDQGIDMTIYDPSGYDFGDSTKVSKGYARDVLVSAYEILKTHPDIARATTQQQYILDTISLSHTYPNIENITNIRFAKTGYTSLAGGNMMAIIEPDPGVFIGIVVMNAGFDSRFTDFEAVVESVQQAYYIIR